MYIAGSIRREEQVLDKWHKCTKQASERSVLQRAAQREQSTLSDNAGPHHQSAQHEAPRGQSTLNKYYTHDAHMHDIT